MDPPWTCTNAFAEAGMDAGTYVWAYMQTDEGTDELAYVCAHTVGWMSGRSDGCTQACTADLYELVTTP